MMVDEESSFYQECANRLMYPLLYYQRQHFWSRAGFAWDAHLHNDLSHPDFVLPKMLCFLNTFYLTDPEVEAIRERLAGSGATVLWFYAPGIQSPDGFDLERTCRLTGFNLKAEDIQALPRITLTNPDHPYLRGAPLAVRDSYISGKEIPLSFGTGPLGNDERERMIGPIFHVDDSEAEVLGELDCLQRPGFCVKEMDGWTSIYVGAPMMNQHLFRNIAREAGVHIFSEDDDVILPGKSFLMLHAREAGEKTVRLVSPSDVYEPYEDREIGEDLEEICEPFEQYETRIYFLGSRAAYRGGSQSSDPTRGS